MFPDSEITKSYHQELAKTIGKSNKNPKLLYIDFNAEPHSGFTVKSSNLNFDWVLNAPLKYGTEAKI